ncbi:hypothetical protein SAMN05444397_11549 [Flavobacterium aquidurense]|nr:hypothetical protein SAMN05444397_11549 [Flavobacterium aquidurense]
MYVQTLELAYSKSGTDPCLCVINVLINNDL